jgi:hypothetical protein
MPVVYGLGWLDASIDTDPPYLKAVCAPRRAELQALLQRISERIGRHLERKGLLVRDVESTIWLLMRVVRTTRSPSFRGIQSRTASRWERTRGARRSCCKAYRVAGSGAAATACAADRSQRPLRLTPLLRWVP